MTNQEQNLENDYKQENKVNSDANHITQAAQKATDEIQDVSEGAQEGDVEDIALEGLEEA